MLLVNAHTPAWALQEVSDRAEQGWKQVAPDAADGIWRDAVLHQNSAVGQSAPLPGRHLTHLQRRGGMLSHSHFHP